MREEISKYSDKELLPLLRKEKDVAEKAFNELYFRHYLKVFNHCKFMLNDTLLADDIFQQTWTRFFETIKKGTEVTHVSTYLLKISNNLCINQKTRAHPTVSIDENENLVNHLVSNEKSYEQDELFELVQTAINLLDDIYRQAFIMKKFDGLSYKEMAEICNISIDGAKKRVKRATEKIMNILEPYLKDLSK